MRKRLLAVAAAALVPATLLLGWNEYSFREQRSEEIRREVMRAASQVGSEVDRIFEGTRTLLVAASSISSIAALEPSSCRETLRELSGKLPAVRTILVVNLRGDVVCDSQPIPLKVNLADRSYFQEALTSRDIVVGQYTLGRLSKDQVLPVALAIWRQDNSVSGVVVAGLRLNWLQKRIEERGLFPGGAVTLADRSGFILVRNPSPAKFVGTQIPEAYRHLVTADEAGSLELQSLDGTYRLIGYQPVRLPERPIYISVGISKSEAFAAINRSSLLSLLAVVAGIVVSFVAATYIGGRSVLRPIERIIDVLDRWTAGEKTLRTNMHGRHGELGLVGDAVDKLLDRIDVQTRETETANQERLLLARELSHRVKNTLSIIQVMARQTFRKIVPDDTFSAFSQRLRALAGAYDVLLADSWESNDIRTVATATLAPHHDSRDPRIHINGPSITLSPEAVISLSLVLHELATNAGKYGALRDENGKVELDWACDGSRINLTWREIDGPPVKAPTSEGFGSSLIKNAFPAMLQAKVAFDYKRDGLAVQLSFAGPQTSS